LEEFFNEVGADEAGAARYEVGHGLGFKVISKW
jgi:hypothetical protein